VRSFFTAQSAQKTATMEGIDQETGESTGLGRSPRFTLWVAFLTFATITMGAAVEVVSRDWRVVDIFLVRRDPIGVVLGALWKNQEIIVQGCVSLLGRH
jgi:hypothetical protein